MRSQTYPRIRRIIPLRCHSLGTCLPAEIILPRSRVTSKAKKILIDRPMQTEFPVSHRKQKTAAFPNRYRFEDPSTVVALPALAQEGAQQRERRTPSDCSNRVTLHSDRSMYGTRRSRNFSASRVSFASSPSVLIATVPRLEIGVTHSYKRRKHFLTATRTRCSFTLTEKINRQPELLESPVSHRKQRPGHQINRQLSHGSFLPFPLFTLPFSKHLPLPNTQNPTPHSLIHPRLDVNPDSCYKYWPCCDSFSLSVRSLSRSLNPEEQCRLGVRNRRFMGVAKISMEAF